MMSTFNPETDTSSDPARSFSPFRQAPTSAEIEAIIAAATANAPPPPEALLDPGPERESPIFMLRHESCQTWSLTR